MATTKKLADLVLSLMFGSLLTGCGPTKPDADHWRLPKKENAGSGMIVGRLDFPDSKTENPDRLMLTLRNVEFRNVAQVVSFGNKGEENFIMANNYFVVPNLKPGTYRFVSFYAGMYHQMRKAEIKIEVPPGQIKFVGSLDYVQYEPGTMRKITNAISNYKQYEFGVKKAPHPTELEMFQWLNRISAGSGWEPAIQKRIRELGAKP